MGARGRPVLVQACLNGGRRRAEHRTVPLAPDEIARDAARAIAAGAGALHIHPRAADGSETLDPAICDAVVLAVRDACPGIPIGLTTAIWIEPDPARRLELVTSWAVPPDFVSVNVSETGVPTLCECLFTRGIGIGWEGAALTGQAHCRIRLQIRRTRLWQGRHRCPEGGRQGRRQQASPAHDSVPHGH